MAGEEVNPVYGAGDPEKHNTEKRSFKDWVDDNLGLAYGCCACILIAAVTVGLAVPLAMCENDKTTCKSPCEAYVLSDQFDGAIDRIMIRFQDFNLEALGELPPFIAEFVNPDPNKSFTLESNLQVLDFSNNEDAKLIFREAFEFFANTYCERLDTLFRDQKMESSNFTMHDAMHDIAEAFPAEGVGRGLKGFQTFAYGTANKHTQAPIDKWHMIGGDNVDPFLKLFKDSSGAEQTITYTNPSWPASGTYKPYKSHQIYTTGAIYAWDKMGGSLGNPNVIVGVIDTGVDITHEDLVDNIWTNPGEIPNNGIDDDGNGKIDDVHGWDFGDSDADPADPDGHGTHCAGIIAMTANNQKGGVGIAPGVKIMPLKILDSMGNMSFSAAYAAMSYAKAKGAQILSNSYATIYADKFDPSARNPNWADSLYYTASFTTEISKLESRGMLFLAAGGNFHINNTRLDEFDYHYLPGNVRKSNVMTVGWFMENGYTMSKWANFGGNTNRNMEGPKAQVHIGAPGEQIYATVPGGYAFKSGSSMATPAAAGIAALVLSALCHHDPSDVGCLDGKGTQVREIMCSSAQNLNQWARANNPSLPQGLPADFDFSAPRDFDKWDGDWTTCGTVVGDAAVQAALDISASQNMGSVTVTAAPQSASSVNAWGDFSPDHNVLLQIYDVEQFSPATVGDVPASVWAAGPIKSIMVADNINHDVCEGEAICNGLIDSTLSAAHPDIGNPSVFDLSEGHLTVFTTWLVIGSASDYGTYQLCVQAAEGDSVEVEVGGVYVGGLTTTGDAAVSGFTLSECVETNPFYVTGEGYVSITAKHLQAVGGSKQALVLKWKKPGWNGYGAINIDNLTGVVPRFVDGAAAYTGVARGFYTNINGYVTGSTTVAEAMSTMIEDAKSISGTYANTALTSAFVPKVMPGLDAAPGSSGGLTHYTWQMKIRASAGGAPPVYKLVCPVNHACTLLMGLVEFGAIAQADTSRDIIVEAIGNQERTQFDLWLVNYNAAGSGETQCAWTVDAQTSLESDFVTSLAGAPTDAPAYVPGVNVYASLESPNDEWSINVYGSAMGWDTRETIGGGVHAQNLVAPVEEWTKYTHSFEAVIPKEATKTDGSTGTVVAIKFQITWKAWNFSLKQWVQRDDGTWWMGTHNNNQIGVLADMETQDAGIPAFFTWRARYVGSARTDQTSMYDALLCFDAACTDTTPIGAAAGVKAPVKQVSASPANVGVDARIYKQQGAWFLARSSTINGLFGDTGAPTTALKAVRTKTNVGTTLDGAGPDWALTVGWSRGDAFVCAVSGYFKTPVSDGGESWYTFKAFDLSSVGSVGVQMTIGGNWNGASSWEWYNNHMTGATIYRDDLVGATPTYPTGDTRTATPVKLEQDSVYFFTLYSVVPAGGAFTCPHNVKFAAKASEADTVSDGEMSVVSLYV